MMNQSVRVNRKKTASELRKTIVQKAAELFAEKGYYETSMQDICDSVGLTKGGLYYHFRQKSDILFEVHEQFINYEIEKAEEILNKNLTEDLCLKELVTMLVESIVIYKPHCIVFYRQMTNLSKDDFEVIRRKRERFFSMFVDCIERGIRKGVFRPRGDLKVLSLGLIGMCNWTMHWISPAGKLSVEEIAGIFYETMVYGIKVNL